MKEKGITLVALVVTIIVLIILTGVSINLLLGQDGIITRAKNGTEKYKEEEIREKVQLILADYMAEKYIGTKTLEEYLNEKKTNGELDEVTNNGDGTITIEVDGYEITIRENDLSIIEINKAGGVRPTFEIKFTKTDGDILTGDETEKAITINITNIGEFGEDYTIEVKDSSGNIISKEADVIADGEGQASYIILKSEIYTITVTATKDGITKTTIKTEKITVTMAQIEETLAFSRANGVIDIVWLDMNNNVISSPISPANYLGGLTAIKYNETTEEIVSDPANDNSWYEYVAQTGTTDGKTSNWANARSSDSNAYFVWIPRYAYKITYFDTEDHANDYRADNNSKTGIIGYSNIEGLVDVASGAEKLVTGSVPTNVTGTVKTNQYADYIPHPAFEFDGSKAGIWVGKFEASGSISALKIIPNTKSLRNATVSNIFTACQGVKTAYSLTGDSHMIKNTEWGAVAYLTESKYGRNGTEITMNNVSTTTGGGNYKLNVLQSTTGNIYGIYDMNGSQFEYVAGYINNSYISSNGCNNNLLNAVNTNSKYADVYPVTTDNQATNYSNSKVIKGDAVYETSTSNSGSTSFHKDHSNFVYSSMPIFRRGRFLQSRYKCRYFFLYALLR